MSVSAGFGLPFDDGNPDKWKKAKEELNERIKNLEAIASPDNVLQFKAENIKTSLHELLKAPVTKESMRKFFNVLSDNFDAVSLKQSSIMEYDSRLAPEAFFKTRQSDFRINMSEEDKQSLPLISLVKQTDSAKLQVADLSMQANLHKLSGDNYCLELIIPQLNTYLVFGSPAIPDAGQAVFVDKMSMKNLVTKFQNKVSDLNENTQNIKDIHQAPAVIPPKPSPQIPTSPGLESRSLANLNLNSVEKLIDSKLIADLSDPEAQIELLKAINSNFDKMTAGHYYDEKIDLINFNHYDPTIPKNWAIFDDPSKSITHGYLSLGDNIKFDIKLFEPRDKDGKYVLLVEIPAYNRLLYFDLNQDLSSQPDLQEQISEFAYKVSEALDNKKGKIERTPKSLSDIQKIIQKSDDQIIGRLMALLKERTPEAIINVFDSISSALSRSKIDIQRKQTENPNMPYGRLLEGTLNVNKRIGLGFRLYTDRFKPDIIEFNMNFRGSPIRVFIREDQSEKSQKIVADFRQAIEKKLANH